MPKAHRPRAVVVSEVLQIALLAEPVARADLRSVISIGGTSVMIGIIILIILQATRRKKCWARDMLAGLAFLGLLSAAYFLVMDAPALVQITAAATTIANFVAVMLLFTNDAAYWFNDKSVRPAQSRATGE